jgi:hypothetical protein
MQVFRATLVVLVALVTSTAAVSAQSTPTSTDPLQVVDAFELARGAGEVDAALAQLADTAVITVQSDSTRSYSGAVQMRTSLQNSGIRFQTIMRSRRHVQGNSVTWIERDEYGTHPVEATVIAIVEDGHIVALSYRATDPPTASGRTDPATARQPIQLPNAAWAGALAVIGSGLLAGVSALPRRKASRSQLHGRLLVGLHREREPEFVRAE